MKKIRINKKALIELVLVVINVIVMVLSGYHIFNLNHLMSGEDFIVYLCAFVITFAIYCYLRYRDETKLIGRWNVTAMLIGLVMALFGGSNVLISSVPETLTIKSTCYALLIIGGVLYGWNDYKSDKLMEETSTTNSK